MPSHEMNVFNTVLDALWTVDIDARREIIHAISRVLDAPTAPVLAPFRVLGAPTIPAPTRSEDLLLIRDAAKVAKISRQAAYVAARRGSLPAERKDGHLMIRRADAIAYRDRAR